MPLKVCIIGSGNWGSAISKLIGYNAARLEVFETSVTMYVYEEYIDGKKLTEIINETHENVKYLPGHKLPTNVFAEPDLTKAVSDADILVFVVPHQFVKSQCQAMKGKIKPTAVGLSLIKGVYSPEGGGIVLISQMIKEILDIDVSVLMGANLASEVADEKFCESTIGSRNAVYSPLFRDLIQTDNFSIYVVDDVETVELCGALKNIVACAAGFVDGLGLGDNTKSAVIRLGLVEMIRFCRKFSPDSKLNTFLQSCGVADLITTCYGGRNRKVCHAFISSGKTIVELEAEMLNGQKLQGPVTAEEVNLWLKKACIEDEFPLFTAVHLICTSQLAPTQLIERIRNQPEHALKI